MAAPSLALLGAKWVAVGVLGGGILAAGADVAFCRKPTLPRAPTTAAPARCVRGAKRKRRVPTRAHATGARDNIGPAAGEQPRDELVEVAAPPARAAETTRSRTLGQEVAVIDRVRAALAAGNTSLALSELDTFARDPPPACSTEKRACYAFTRCATQAMSLGRAS